MARMKPQKRVERAIATQSAENAIAVVVPEAIALGKPVNYRVVGAGESVGAVATMLATASLLEIYSI